MKRLSRLNPLPGASRWKNKKDILPRYPSHMASHSFSHRARSVGWERANNKENTRTRPTSKQTNKHKHTRSQENPTRKACSISFKSSPDTWLCDSWRFLCATVVVLNIFLVAGKVCHGRESIIFCCSLALDLDLDRSILEWEECPLVAVVVQVRYTWIHWPYSVIVAPFVGIYSCSSFKFAPLSEVSTLHKGTFTEEEEIEFKKEPSSCFDFNIYHQKLEANFRDRCNSSLRGTRIYSKINPLNSIESVSFLLFCSLDVQVFQQQQQQKCSPKQR